MSRCVLLLQREFRAAANGPPLKSGAWPRGGRLGRGAGPSAPGLCLSSVPPAVLLRVASTDQSLGADPAAASARAFHLPAWLCSEAGLSCVLCPHVEPEFRVRAPPEPRVRLCCESAPAFTRVWSPRVELSVVQRGSPGETVCSSSECSTECCRPSQPLTAPKVAWKRARRARQEVPVDRKSVV